MPVIHFLRLLNTKKKLKGLVPNYNTFVKMDIIE